MAWVGNTRSDGVKVLKEPHWPARPYVVESASGVLTLNQRTTATSGQYRPRRYKTLEAAQKAADKAWPLKDETPSKPRGGWRLNEYQLALLPRLSRDYGMHSEFISIMRNVLPAFRRKALTYGKANTYLQRMKDKGIVTFADEGILRGPNWEQCMRDHGLEVK